MLARVLTTAVLVAAALGWSTEVYAGARYFGYYGSHYINAPFASCTDEPFTNHTNVAMVHSLTAGGFPAKLQAAAVCNQRSILNVWSIFFTDDGSGNGAALVGDPEVQAQTLRNAFTATDLARIVAFHTIDEPFWNINPATVTDAKKAALKTRIDAVHLALKHQFPDIPIWVNFAFPELLHPHGNEMPGIPALTDWVSFDCYMDAGRDVNPDPNVVEWIPGSFEMCGPTSIQAYVDDLKRRMNDSQKLVLVPPAFVHRPYQALPNDCATRYAPADQVPGLADFVDKYLNLARTEQRVVAVMPYEWVSTCYGLSFHAAVSDTPGAPMAAVLAKFRTYGQEIKNGPVVIDNPRAVGHTTTIVRGWALDRRAASGIGVDAVHVYAWPTQGGSAIFLGAATLGRPSPEAAIVHGSAYSTAGYELTTIGSLPIGTYALTVYAHNTFNGLWNQSVQPLEVRASNPLMSVDTPTQNQTVGSWFAISGWAIDLAETATTGVDAVDVWVGPAGGVPTTYLGNAALNGDRPDVAAAFGFGVRFRYSGFNTIVSLSPGSYDLFIYARSTVTGTFNNAILRRVTVQ